jgi:hypothetical protein
MRIRKEARFSPTANLRVTKSNVKRFLKLVAFCVTAKLFTAPYIVRHENI